MSTARSYVEQNTRERKRLRAIVARASDDDLRCRVNEDWTVAGVLGHIAFWDAWALALAEKLERRVPFSSSDAEPEDVSLINDSMRPLIHALAPRAAAELAVHQADETDRRMAALSPALIAQTWPTDPDSPLNPTRARHRAEHLDDIEAAFARSGA